MRIGDKVRVTSGQLGGWDNELCRGRAYQTVVRGAEGEVVREAEWMSDGGQRADEPGVWFVVRFDVVGAMFGGAVYVPCVEPDHVEVIA